MCQTLPCRAPLLRKAVRLQKTITAKTLVLHQVTANRALADTDSHCNSRLHQTSSLKSKNLASLVSGQMVVIF
jgi:hypothetical protein